MGTGGSRGIRTSHDYVRRGGAAARMMLMQAAADEWKVPVAELTVAAYAPMLGSTEAAYTEQLRNSRGRDQEAELAKANIRVPIIFITGHGDIPMTVRAMKGGAVDFLTKPFRDQDLLDAIVSAIDRDRRRREADKTVANLQALYDTLSSREREVLGFVAAGLMNKQIAAELDLAEITVKIYRGHIMKKMHARSLADLIRMTETLGIRPAKPSGGPAGQQ